MYRDDQKALHLRVQALETDLQAERARREHAEAALAREYEESLATSETIDTKLRRLAPTFAQVSPRRRIIALVVFSLLAMAAAFGIGLVVRWVRLRNAEQGAVRTVQPQARGGASDHRVVAARGPG